MAEFGSRLTPRNLLLSVQFLHDDLPIRIARRALELRPSPMAYPLNLPFSNYIPTHLHLVVFELVKNSLHAVQDRFMDSNEVAPPIRIIVTEGIEDVTIKVSDEGGGIPRSGLAKIFTYLYGTAKYPLDEQVDLGIFDTTTMAGYGYGLPISRLYARYFGGDLQIISMEGYVLL